MLDHVHKCSGINLTRRREATLIKEDRSWYFALACEHLLHVPVQLYPIEVTTFVLKKQLVSIWIAVHLDVQQVWLLVQGIDDVLTRAAMHVDLDIDSQASKLSLNQALDLLVRQQAVLALIHALFVPLNFLHWVCHEDDHAEFSCRGLAPLLARDDFVV